MKSSRRFAQIELRNLQRIDVRDGAIVVLELDSTQQTRDRTVIARGDIVTGPIGKHDRKGLKLPLVEPCDDLSNNRCSRIRDTETMVDPRETSSRSPPIYRGNLRTRCVADWIPHERKKGRTLVRPFSNQPVESRYASICGRPFSGQSMWKNLPRGLSVRS